MRFEKFTPYLLVFLLGLSGCTVISHLDQITVLSQYSREKEAQHRLVKSINDHYDALAKVIAQGHITDYQDELSVEHAFGEPILKKDLPDGSQRWLYRYAIFRLAKDKVYLYFDHDGKMLEMGEITMFVIFIGIAVIVVLFATIVVLVLFMRKMEVSQNDSVAQLELRKQAIEHTVAGLKEELGKYQQILRESEGDRARKFGSLENELKNASIATQKLQETTVKLNNILGNVKLRGQWGERMAEDIIHYAGLIDVNYHKQTANSSSTKPDFTFLLPQGHCINMDVKFPLDNYLQMVNTAEGMQKDSYEKEFIKNVKDRIKEIQSRDYINPKENTLDFVLLFIPNEQVFAFIQEKMPDVMDFALKQKVVLCSPFTLYAMLSVVRQAHEHFRFEKDIKKIIELIEGFTKDYELFKNRFADLGILIDRLGGQYSDINDKSFKKLDGKIQRIEDHKKGHLLIDESLPKDLIDAA